MLPEPRAPEVTHRLLEIRSFIVQSDWLLDSISNYQPQSLDRYLLKEGPLSDGEPVEREEDGEKSS